LYSTSGTLQAGSHIVRGSVSAPATVTLTGSAVFTSAGSYSCTVSNTTDNSKGVQVANTSGSKFVITPNVANTVNFICVGN